MLDLNTILELEPSFVLRGVSGKYWALDTSSGSQYKLNEIAYFILSLMRKPVKIEQIVEEILKEYDVSCERAEKDCLQILQFAAEKGIVKEVLL